MNPRNFTGEVPWFAFLIQGAVIVAVAAFSYRFVEDPIRHGAIGRFINEWRAREAPRRALVGKKLVPMTSALVLAGAAVIVCVAVPPVAALPKEETPAAAALPDTGSAPPVDSVLWKDPSLDPDADPHTRARFTNFLLIGDSVTASMDAVERDGYGTFARHFPRAVLNSAISRQLTAAREFYVKEIEAGWDGNIVVFELGSNAAATEEQVREMVNLVPSSKTVLLVNVRTPYPWQDANNDLFEKVAAERQNVTLVDWHQYSKGHDDWFDGDGTHLTPSGCDKYLQMIEKALVRHYEGEVAQARMRAGEAVLVGDRPLQGSRPSLEGSRGA